MPVDLPPGPRCLREEACRQVIAALASPDRTTRVSPEAARLRVAWKTGTSSGHHDAWCAAVTPRLTVVAWLGNPDGRGSPALVGQEAAAPLALGLAAALDDSGEPWPAPPETAPAPVPATLQGAGASAGARSIALVSPAAGREFVLSPDLPRDRQRVLLEAAVRGEGASAARLWWFVDGDPAGSGRAGERRWWTPTPGTHEVRVIDAGGHSAAARIHVRAAPAEN